MDKSSALVLGLAIKDMIYKAQKLRIEADIALKKERKSAKSNMKESTYYKNLAMTYATSLNAINKDIDFSAKYLFDNYPDIAQGLNIIKVEKKKEASN